MRAFILMFVVLLLPAGVWPQVQGDLLTRLSVAADEKLYDRVENLLRQMVDDDVESAEMFYWVHLGRNHVLAPGVARELAVFFEQNYDYDKANVFYKEYARFASDDVSRLLAVARTDVLRGKADEAIRTYEQVLGVEPDNLDAHIYAGNYYYLQAKLERQRVESDYKRIKSPTRMQYAYYREELQQVFGDKYAKARTHFAQVVRQFSSVGARKALVEIGVVEKEIFF